MMTIWLVSAGKITFSACGSTILMKTCRGRSPSASAASRWPMRHGVEAGADDLGGVGRHVERHGEDGGDDRIEPDAEARQAEEDEEQLHQERRVADELDIDGDRLPQQAVAAAPGSRAERC